MEYAIYTHNSQNNNNECVNYVNFQYRLHIKYSLIHKCKLSVNFHFPVLTDYSLHILHKISKNINAIII